MGILVIGLVAASHPVHAAERVTITVAAFGNTQFVPYDVAVALGAFAEQGLEVDSQYMQDGSKAAAALLGGSADFAVVNFDHAIKTGLQGKALPMVAAFSEVSGMKLIVRTDLRDAVKTLRDVKGRPIGVTGLGAATHLMLSYVLTHGGLKPEEINAVPIGYTAMPAALVNRKVDGLMVGGVGVTKLVAEGQAFILLNLTDRERAAAFFGGPYLETGVLTRTDVIAQRPDVVRRLVRAIVKTNRWIAAHTPSEIAAVLPGAIVQDRALFLQALEEVHRGFSATGRVDPRAVETVIAMHRAFGTISADRHIDVAGLYNNTFVEEVLAADSK